MEIKKILKGNKSGGEGIYSHYRIPGIVITNRDTVIIYFEARVDLSDWANMDIITFRSTDGGQTFSQPMKLVEGVEMSRTVNQPVMIVGNDPQNTIHFLYTVETGICKSCGDAARSRCPHNCGVFYKRSTDDGLTWSEPINISDSTAPDMRNVFAVGPGHGICLNNGTLVSSVWYVRKDLNQPLDSHYTSEVSTLYSIDNGKTWHLGEQVPIGDSRIWSPNESMLAETSYGEVMLSIRNGQSSRLNESDPHRRAVSWSPTGFSSWTPMVYDQALVDPTCMGSLYAYRHQGHPNMILSSNCNHTGSRRNLTLRISSDNGKTWAKEMVVDEGLAGYSDIAVDSEGTVYIVYEVEAGLTVNFAKIPSSEI